MLIISSGRGCQRSFSIFCSGLFASVVFCHFFHCFTRVLPTNYLIGNMPANKLRTIAAMLTTRYLLFVQCVYICQLSKRYFITWFLRVFRANCIKNRSIDDRTTKLSYVSKHNKSKWPSEKKGRQKNSSEIYLRQVQIIQLIIFTLSACASYLLVDLV